MPNDDFTDLLDKGGEFYAAARHLNPRGMTAVIEECKPIVKALKARGMTFENLTEFMTKVGGRAPKLEEDPFLTSIKDLWNAE